MTGVSRRTGLFGLGRPKGEDQTSEDQASEDQASEDQASEDSASEDQASDDQASEDQAQTDGDAPADDDGDEGETDAAARKARGRERQRIARIFGASAAVGRTALAAELACGTGLSSGQAVRLLAAAPQEHAGGPAAGKSRLSRAMRAEGVKGVGPGGISAGPADDGWGQAMEKAGVARKEKA